MRTVAEVVFDSDDEKRAFQMAGRWVGAEGAPDEEIERGARAVRHHNRNHAYNHRVLTAILAWIEDSVLVFELRRADGHKMKAAATNPDNADRVPVLLDPAQAGTVMIESAVEALDDLTILRPVIEQGLRLATPPVEDRKYVA